jgi:hypothetical protein
MDWASYDAGIMTRAVSQLAGHYKANGRLPFPCGLQVREAHAKLAKIIEGMDARLEEIT